MAHTRVDHNEIKFAQITIVLTVVAAWLADLPWLVAALAVILLVGVALPLAAPLRFLYRHAAVPLGVVRPNLVPDEPAPHRFAQGLGGTFLLVGTAAFSGGVPVAGWILAGVVAKLAAVNVLWNFCAGCFIYYQLRRAGVLGRKQAA